MSFSGYLALKKPLWLASVVFATATFLPARAEVENPYAFIVGASAVNICFTTYGYLTAERAVELLGELADENNISRFQVSNIINNKSFKRDVSNAIKMIGGCSSIIAEFRRSQRRSKRSLTEGKLATEAYYGANPADTFSKLNQLTP